MIYLDVNTLYAHSKIQLLPIEILYWVDPKGFNLENYSDNGSEGCFLEVDFDYSDKLYYLHNDFPLAPEKVTKEMLSEYQLQIIEDNKLSLSKNKKLISNLGNKEFHYRNLKLYLELELALKKFIEYWNSKKHSS